MAANILFCQKPHWCLTFLTLPMILLPVFAAKDPVPIDIHTGVYNNSLVSSCLPTDSRNISAVHNTFVSLLSERNDTDAIWLPIQRRDLGGWYWLSGEFEEMASLPDRGPCAVLRATDMVLGDVVCDRQYHKYLCQKKDCNWKVSDGNCIVDAGTQYTIVEKSGSWYEARAGCYERGEQLASLPKANRRHFLEKIRRMTKFFPDIWVGLRRMDYFIVEENTSVEAYNWRKGDTCPCNSPHSCLALERIEKNIFFWKPRNCSKLIPTIVCDQRRREDATTMRQVMVGGGTDIGITLGLGVPCFIVVAVVMGLLVWMICRKILASRIKPHKHSLKTGVKKINVLLSSAPPSVQEPVNRLCKSCQDLHKENERLKSELDSTRKRLQNSKILSGPEPTPSPQENIRNNDGKSYKENPPMEMEQTSDLKETNPMLCHPQQEMEEGKIGNNDEKCWEENPPMEMEQTPDLEERKNKLNHLRKEMEEVLIMAEKESLSEELRECLEEFVKEQLPELIKEYEETIQAL